MGNGDLAPQRQSFGSDQTPAKPSAGPSNSNGSNNSKSSSGAASQPQTSDSVYNSDPANGQGGQTVQKVYGKDKEVNKKPKNITEKIMAELTERRQAAAAKAVPEEKKAEGMFGDLFGGPKKARQDAKSAAQAESQNLPKKPFFDFKDNAVGLKAKSSPELSSSKKGLRAIRDDLKGLGFSKFSRRDEIAKEIQGLMKETGALKDKRLSRNEFYQIEKKLRDEHLITKPQFKRMVKGTGSKPKFHL
ncbi:MAG: hypothetical protein ACM3KM_03650 [Acidobacteriaceae bacterium]